MAHAPSKAAAAAAAAAPTMAETTTTTCSSSSSGFTLPYIPPMGAVEPEVLAQLDARPPPAWTETAAAVLEATPWVAALRASDSVTPVTVPDHDQQMIDGMPGFPYRSFSYYKPLLQFHLEFYQPTHADANEVHAVLYFSEYSEGPPGFVHGGAVATAFDEVLGFTNLCYGHFGPTLQLDVSYYRGTPLCRPLFMVGRIVRLEGRKIHLEGVLRASPDAASPVIAEARALWYNEAQVLREASPDAAGAAGLGPSELVMTAFTTQPSTIGVSPRAVPAWLEALRADPDCTKMIDSSDFMNRREELMGEYPWRGINFILNSGRVSVELYHRASDHSVVAAVEVSNFVQGPPGCVNGGCIFAILDNIAGIALWSVHGVKGFTKRMAVSYKKFTRISTRYYFVETRLLAREGRQGTLELTLRNPAADTVHAVATVTFAANAAGQSPRAVL